MELFSKLGIDWRLLIAQLVNFAILFGALTFFLYKPLLKVLDDRRKKVADSLANAEKIGDELRRAGEEAAKIASQARAEAQKIVGEAQKSAEALRVQTAEKVKAEVSALIAGGRAQLAREREELIAEVRASAAEMVGAAVEKLIGEKLTAAKDKALVEKALEGAKERS